MSSSRFYNDEMAIIPRSVGFFFIFFDFISVCVGLDISVMEVAAHWISVR